MKKRVLSILLALCMVLTLLPTAALATESGVTAEPVAEEPTVASTEEPVMTVTINGSATNYTDPAEGWNKAAEATGAVTVQLLANWTAAPADAALVTSFGTGVGFKPQGYIHVPDGKTITLDLNDYTIDRGLQKTAVSEGEVIAVKGTLTLKDSGTVPAKQGTITGANSNDGYGAVYVEGGSFTMEGGSITGNKASNTGIDGTAAAGGVYSSGVFTMTGGSITGNTGSGVKSVGGVFVANSNGSTFTMTGGSITGNTSNSGAGGVLVATGTSGSNNTLTVGGTAQITGNKLTGGTTSNVLLQTGKTITCSTTTPLASGATIGVTTETKPTAGTPVAITGVSSANYSSFFFSDNAAYETRNSDGNVVQLLLNSDDFAGGDGTPSNPYLIATAEQLSRLTAKVNNGEGDYAKAHYQLMNGIDLAGFGNWIPIGNLTNAFKGTFDGNDKTITGLTVTGGDYSGLFGWIWDATVKNLTVSNGSVSGGQSTGAIVGYAVSSTIENCHNKNVTVAGTNNGIGGIVGYLNSSTLSNSTNSAAVSSTAGLDNVGGVVGMNDRSAVVNCVNYGNVTITSDNNYSQSVGGVVGHNFTTVTNCANYGAVTNSNAAQSTINDTKKATGGVVGLNESTVTNCVNGGTVTDGATSDTAGYVGGVVGYNSKTTSVVKFSYAVTTPVVGENEGNITGCGTFANTSVITLGNDYVGADDKGIVYTTYVPDDNTALDKALNSWVEKAGGKENVNFWEIGSGYLVPTLLAVTFDATGGSAIPKMVTTTEGKLESLPTPTRGDHTFDGWFTAENGGEKVTTGTVFTTSTTIYAHWTAVAPPPPPPPPPATGGGDAPSGSGGSSSSGGSGGSSPSGGSGGSTPTLVTELKAGGILTASNLDQLVSGQKALTVTGTEGAKLVFDTDALRGINDQTSGGVKVDIKDVSDDYPDSHEGKTVFSLTVTSGGKTVSDFGGKVTISLPYTLKDGEKAEDVTVWHLADDGTMTEIPATYDPKTGLATATVNHFSQYVVGVAPWVNPFTDVQAGDWCYDAVKFVHKNGLFSGVNDTAFAPNASMNRAMLWMVLARQDGRDTAGGSPWYEIGLNWAKETGISDGTKPMDKLTREQLITMLWRYAGSPVLMDYPGLSSFTDAGDIAAYAQQAMAWAHQKGLVQGSNNALNPKQNASRAQVAAILMRYCENVAK